MTIKDLVKKIIPSPLLGFYHFCWALLGAVIFGFPGKSKSFKIIGITGTSGKSTTSDLVTRILEEAQPSPEASAGKAGNKVASISTIRFKIADKEWENKYKMTMPGRFVIQRFLKQAKKAGCNFIVLEITSQGIEQFRHKFINFDTAVFTNLSPEHIESHHGFENYRNEKLKLFKVAKNVHVINIDDENAKYFLDIPANKKITFGKTQGNFNLQNTSFNLSLAGDFNKSNALAAICVARNYGISLDVCKRALEKAKGIAGRMEVIQKEPFKVIVDYAHTPEQLESVYKSFEGKPLICVLGSCGGGRDKWKRPVLGEIAKKYCKEIIVTNEDPYDENPLSIMKEIESALSHDGANPKHHMILDRKEAIEVAIKSAKPGDAVVITGKGSEPWMCVANGKKISWDDRKIAKEKLEAVKNQIDN
jgi:UDP-N-acetylmuramoyl-L-alanyl-D-glutamate--2,6-diaminopimelate ligase